MNKIQQNRPKLYAPAQRFDGTRTDIAEPKGAKRHIPPAWFREQALKDAAEAGVHGRFRCPSCAAHFLLDYGRWSRDHWPHEYELHCIDCIHQYHLELQRLGTARAKPKPVAAT